MTNKLKLQESITKWGGKSAYDIAKIFDIFRHESFFIDSLLELICEPSCQKGATWLLKAWLNDGGQLTKQQISKISASLHTLAHWETKLHALQCLPFLTIDQSEKKLVETFLRITLSGQNKFVRAWSYNGFYELARQYPEYQAETKILFEMAMNDEAASVKARVRNLIRKGF